MILDVIIRKGNADIVAIKAWDFDEKAKTESDQSENQNNKLLNIVYNDSKYFVYEPKNSD